MRGEVQVSVRAISRRPADTDTVADAVAAGKSSCAVRSSLVLPASSLQEAASARTFRCALRHGKVPVHVPVTTSPPYPRTRARRPQPLLHLGGVLLRPMDAGDTAVRTAVALCHRLRMAGCAGAGDPGSRPMGADFTAHRRPRMVGASNTREPLPDPRDPRLRHGRSVVAGRGADPGRVRQVHARRTRRRAFAAGADRGLAAKRRYTATAPSARERSRAVGS